MWRHFPSGRHTSREQTAAQVGRFVASWERDGLGYWTACLPDGTFVGIGGVAVRQDVVWNVYYRVVPEQQRHGYAREVVAAARAAAARVRPDLPVTAFLLEHNVASRRTAEAAGLTLVWRGPDADNPDPDAVRLIFADRPLPAETRATLAAAP